MRFEIEPGTQEYWYLVMAVAFYTPHIIAATLKQSSR